MRRIVPLIALTLAAAACGTAAGSSTLTAARTGTQHGASLRAASTRAAAPHVFLIVLENESFADTYRHNPNPYLGKTLQRQGTLLTQYYAVGHHSNDNYLAMISGQAPNSATSADCPTYNLFNGTTHAARIGADGQAIGAGCVYPTNVRTLANQLHAARLTWHGYMEDMGNTPSREQSTCGVPTVSKQTHLDETQSATPKDQYAARHNPFVYFRSLITSGLCKANVGPLTPLRDDLKKLSGTPDFSLIIPNLCDDGHDSPCKGKDSLGSRVGGLTSVDHFLSVWIPRIEASPAYKKNGLIVITSDESEKSDASACCGERPGPSDRRPGIIGLGGGRIGALIIGRCVRRGARDPAHYNHYSLLLSVEDIYRIKTHLGYAGAKGLKPFGRDVFAKCSYGSAH